MCYLQVLPFACRLGDTLVVFDLKIARLLSISDEGLLVFDSRFLCRQDILTG